MDAIQRARNLQHYHKPTNVCMPNSDGPNDIEYCLDCGKRVACDNSMLERSLRSAQCNRADHVFVDDRGFQQYPSSDRGLTENDVRHIIRDELRMDRARQYQPPLVNSRKEERHVPMV